MPPSPTRGPDRPYRRVVLLGFMASGKSSVGRALAARLGWAFVDLDAEIEREAGRSVAEIFATSGEAEFRRLEAELTPRFVARDDVVLAPGGGWVTVPGLLAGLPADTLTVWLRVSPAEVVRRVKEVPGQPVRPLLAGDEPLRRVEELLARREALYRRADIVLDTDGRTVEELVGQLTDIVEAGKADVDGGRA